MPKISQLPILTNINTGSVIPIVDNSRTQRISVGKLYEFLSGALDQTFSTEFELMQSASAITSSIQTLSASLNTTITNITVGSASIPPGTVSSSNQITTLGFAKTGSNAFNGSQTISAGNSLLVNRIENTTGGNIEIAASGLLTLSGDGGGVTTNDNFESNPGGANTFKVSSGSVSITGSIYVSGTPIISGANQIANLGFATTSSILNVNTSSLLTTASFNQYTSSLTASVNINTSSLATTGSNSFNGSQTILAGNSLLVNRIENTTGGNIEIAASGLLSLSGDGGGVTTNDNFEANPGGNATFKVTSGSISITGSISATGTTLISSSTQITNFGFATTSSIVNVNTSSLVTTSSFNSYTASAGNVSSASLVTTASFNSYTSSINSSIIALQSSASNAAGYDNLFTQWTTVQFNPSFTASFYSSSILLISASALATSASNLNTFSASVNGKTGSFATTGSNEFNGNQTITGSLNLTDSVNINSPEPTPLSIGDSFGGGKLAYILTPTDAGYDSTLIKGIVAATADESTAKTWTNAITASNDKVANGYDDWYLPSKDELNKLYLNKDAIGGFVGASYWSSTQSTSTNAWFQLFTAGGTQLASSKTLSNSVRAIRAFSIPKSALNIIGNTTITGSLNISGGLVFSDATTQTTAFVPTTYATTGSNEFNGNQTITGSLNHGLGNTAAGENSHAEGDSTQAIGLFSHAEGLGTIAYGGRSHAEGQDTIASGSYSHAEGYQTIALADHQHVQGQFNATSSVLAAFIVGNGTDDSNRSNLIHAAGNTVEITGSLNVSGSTSISGGLTITNNGYSWSFESNGRTKIPNITFNSDRGTGMVGIKPVAGREFQIETSTTASSVGPWSFGLDGTLSAPAGANITRVANLITTSSFNTFTSSYTNASSSFDSRITSIAITGAPAGTVSSSQQITNLGFATTSSVLNVDTSSLVTTSSFNSFSSSVNSTTASLNSFTASVASTGSINSLTASFIAFSSSINTFTSSVNTTTASLSSKTGSYATTGSNSFTGSQNISGSLTVSSVFTISASIGANSSSLTLNSGSNLYIQNNGYFELSGSALISGSLIAIGATNLVTTSSFNAFSSSINTTTASLNTFSSSINTFSSSVNTTTSSLNSFTSSVIATGSLINTFTSSINAFTASERATGSILNTFTSSVNTFTASVIATGSLINTFTSSINAFTASERASGSIINTFTASVNTTTASLNSKTGSYATTGSNQFNGNQSITGSLVVTLVSTISGSIAANASSLTLSSGSNLYIQNNGLVEISGSLNVSGSSLLTGSVTINESRIDNAWTSYTPTWEAPTPPAIGNGTITGAYKVIGKTCFVRGRITMGSTTTYGSGDWSIGLPVAAINAYAIQIPASLLDGSGGTGWYNALMNGAVALNTISSQILANLPPSFGGSTAGGISSIFPFTWGSGDALYFNGSYEIA